MPQQLMKSMNASHLENGTYLQTVTHLETKLVLNVLQAPDELQVNNVSQAATNTNSVKPKRATTLKNQDFIEIYVFS